MADNEKVSIWGGVPHFGTTPTVGQAIAGSGDGFIIYESAEDNTGIVPIAVTPLPNKNMEIAKKTVGGVTTKYYGFAGYNGSYYSDENQYNLTAANFVHYNNTIVQYDTDAKGTPKTRLTALHPGTYRISGTLQFYSSSAMSATALPVDTGVTPNVVYVYWSAVAMISYVVVYLVKNSVPVPWTYMLYSMVGNSPRITVNVDYLVTLGKNEYVELVWASADANMYLRTEGANYPSALINMTLVR